MSALISFSIPNRIEPSATIPSEITNCIGNLFQYPQSDRALCNLFGGTIGNRMEKLSVSPIGSSPLQPPLAICMTSVTRSFSIPNRIEPSATVLKPRVSRLLPLSFSIPNRIEPSATNCRHAAQDAMYGNFQYPQSDRALCNTHPPREHTLS